MALSVPVIVKCQDPGDSSGDVIIDLPTEMLTAMNVGIGDLMSIELFDGSIVLKPIREADTKPQRLLS